MFSFPLDDSSRLVLLQLHHADALFRAVDGDRARLRAWLPWVDATRTVADTEVFIRRTLRDLAEGAGLVTGIEVGGALVGTLGVHQINPANRSCAIGYWIHRDYEGRGIVTRGVAAMVDRCFGPMGLTRIEIRCGTGNLRSRAVPVRLGFTHEGTLRQAETVDGRALDHDIFSLLASDPRPAWPSPAAPLASGG